MYDSHTVEIIVLSSATRNMATKAETIRQTTLRVDWCSGGPEGPREPPAVPGALSLTSASECSFNNSEVPILAVLVLSDVEVCGGGTVVIVVPLSKMRPIGY